MGSGVQAQDSQPEKPTPKVRPERKAGAEASVVKQRLERLAEQLKLTDEQKTKVREILREQVKQLRGLRQDQSMARADKVAKLKEIRESLQSQIEPVLTEEQLEKWKAILERQQQRRKAGGE